jgi:cell division septation protein DedD
MHRLLIGVPFSWCRKQTARAGGLFRTVDDRFTDEEVLMILHAGESSLKLADVCAAGGISTVTYANWKAKYYGLAPADVRIRRSSERRKRRATGAGVAALIVLSVGAAGLLIGMPNLSSSHQVLAKTPVNLLPLRQTVPLAAFAALGTMTTPVALPDSPRVVAPARASQPEAPRQSGQRAIAAEPVKGSASAKPVNAADIKASDPSGYSVQVAAVPDLREARAVLEQLAEAGHHAYLTAKMVDNVELYRVRVGPFQSRSEAEEVVRRLGREGHRAAWITK